jgi:sulfur carrier protein
VIEVRVNGVDREVPEGSTVTDLLAALGIAPAGVAVAVDGVLVPRPEHDGTVLPDGSAVEVLTAVQGG